jgi:L-fuculose-phosphate aldolase
MRRRALLEAAQKMSALGLSPGTSGNLSLRAGDGILITPSGLPYDQMTRMDIVELDARGAVREGRRTPSTEWRLHVDLYAARREIGAIVHAHSMFATTLSCVRRGIPAFHYMIAVAGGSSIRCAEYATFGTAELAENTLFALEGRRACLLANHGMVAVAADIEGALRLAIEVENLAAQYWRALQIGEPVILDEEEMARVIERFKSYGASR